MRRFFDIVVMAMLVVTLAVGSMAPVSGPSVPANTCETICTLWWTIWTPLVPDKPASSGIQLLSVGWNG